MLLSGSTNYDVINDATPDGDVTRPDINKGIARARYTQKHSFVSKIGCIKSSLSVYCQTVTRITLLLAIIINVLGGLNNIRLYERKSTVGNSSSLFLSGLLSEIRSYVRININTFIHNVWEKAHKSLFHFFLLS